MSNSKDRLAPAEEVMTLTDAANFMRVSTRTIRRWADRGLIKTYRLKDVGGANNRRYLRSELLALLEPEEGHRPVPESLEATVNNGK